MGGCSVLMALYFKGDVFNGPVNEGIRYMGFTILVITMLVWLMHFPMWGSMAFPPKRNADGTEAEKKEGKHLAAAKFAENAKIQRMPVDRPSNEEPLEKVVRVGGCAPPRTGGAPVTTGP